MAFDSFSQQSVKPLGAKSTLLGGGQSLLPNIMAANQTAISGINTGGTSRAGSLANPIRLNSGNANTNTGIQLDPTQTNILNQLYGYAQTGQYGDQFTAGKGYGEPTGYYNLGEFEQDAASALSDLSGGGLPEMFQLAQNEVKGILEQDSFDPYNEKGTFAGFKENLEVEQQKQSDVLNRNLNVLGDLYSTRTVQEQGNLAEAGQRALTTELGRLYENYTGQRERATGQAADLGKMEELMEMSRIQEQQRIGQIQRELKDQQAKDKYSEWLIGRQEVTDVLNRAENLTSKEYSTGGSGGSSGGGGSSGNFNNTSTPSVSATSNALAPDTRGRWAFSGDESRLDFHSWFPIKTKYTTNSTFGDKPPQVYGGGWSFIPNN